MRRKNLIKILTLLILFFIIVFSVFHCRTKIGDEVDSYKGVKVYNNGVKYTKCYGKNYSQDGYYYGQKWQCVEFVKRFYYEAKGHKMPDVYGHAKDFFDAQIAQGELNESRGLIQYRNGSTAKPQPDDLIVFNDTEYGHVAIITKVTNKYVEIIQQNVFKKTRAKLKIKLVNNNYIVGDKQKPAGWLRKEGDVPKR